MEPPADAYAVAPQGNGTQAEPSPFPPLDPGALATTGQHLELLQSGQANGVQNSQSFMQNFMQNFMQDLGAGSGVKMEDYFANLQANLGSLQGEEAAAIMAQTAEGTDEADGANPDKPLTSKFRGVCWNKKNKRWQAAINSSGKYIYLGSYVQEDEAARSFDRAAIRLRGERAKLNYKLADYKDEFGNIVEDKKLSEHLNSILGKGQGQGGPKGNKGGGGAAAKNVQALRDGSVDAPDFQSVLGSAQQQQPQQQPQPQPQLQHVGANGSAAFDHSQQLVASVQEPDVDVTAPAEPPPPCPYNGGFRHNYGVVDVPEGCSLTAHIPGDKEVFAVLYAHDESPGYAGAAIWDGRGVVDLGMFDTDRDARQAAGGMLRLAMSYMHTFRQAGLPVEAANGDVAGDGHTQLGAPTLGAGDDEQSIAAAAAAAAAAASAEARHIEQHQYKDLLNWLSEVQGMSGQRSGGGGATAEAATPVGAAEHSGSGLGAAEAGAEVEGGEASRVGCEQGLASTAAAAQEQQVKAEVGEEGQQIGVRASKRARKGHREPNPDEVDGGALQDTMAWVHTQSDLPD